jgi:hypothetical protein
LRLRLLTFVRSDRKERSKRQGGWRSDEKAWPFAPANAPCHYNERPYVLSTRRKHPSMSFRTRLSSRGEILTPEVSEAALRLRLLTFVRSDRKERSKRQGGWRSDEKAWPFAPANAPCHYNERPYVLSTRRKHPSMSFRTRLSSRGEILTPAVSEVAFRLRLLTFVRSDRKERSKRQGGWRSDEKSCPTPSQGVAFKIPHPPPAGFGMTF